MNGIKYFSQKEFVCPCCGELNIHYEFLLVLDELRRLCGFPLIVSSGYRCPKHNASVGGVKDSAHVKGLAVDLIAENSHKRHVILKKAFEINIQRIGIGQSFIHLDIDTTKPQQVVWVYKN